MSIIEEAIVSLADEDIKKARETLIEASCMDLKSSEAEFLIALTYVFCDSNLLLAQFSFEECLARNPNSVGAHVNLALVLILKNQMAAATAHLEQARNLAKNQEPQPPLELIQNVCLLRDQLDDYGGSDKKTLIVSLDAMKASFDDTSRYNNRRGWRYMKPEGEGGRSPELLKVFSFRTSEGKRIGRPFEDMRNVSHE